MATNLVSVVMQFLTPELIGRIAAALGLDRNNAQTAVGAAVPALLSGFFGATAKPGGTQSLVDAVKQQSGALDSFPNMIGGSGQSSLVDKGSALLKSLVGGQDQSALAGAVSKFAGVDRGAGNSLLAMLAPVIMGVIGKQIGGRNLDAGSLTGLLADQKDNVAAALPSGFGSLLGGTGLLDALGGAARTATAAGGEAARAATSAARVVGDTGRRAASTASSAPLNWLYWAIPALAIAALLLYLFARPAEQVVQQGVTAAQNLTVGGVDIGKQMTDSIATLRTTLTGITDATSAQAALPKLREVTTQVDKVSGLIGQLSAEQRKVVAGLINPFLPTINQLFDKVLALPGVADILRPTIDALKAKLTVLSS